MDINSQSSKKIAILSTGDELIRGDVLNSNTQEIASLLFENGMQIQTHMSALDNIDDITRNINYLLTQHEALILTGGLGPTSDDLTRYALGKALQRKLIFDGDTWQTICARLQRFGYATPPETNRRQAEFPEGAHIIANPNGTAAGCVIQVNHKTIFMLPGPPDECLPMFKTVVLPFLKKEHFQQTNFHKKWLLLGVSEGKIAEELDTIAKPYACQTGYRLCYPYLEFKIYSQEENDFKNVINLIENAIKPHLVSRIPGTASEILIKILSESEIILNISDTATGGLLESTLCTPATYERLIFNRPRTENVPLIHIEGLKEYWQETPDVIKTNIGLSFSDSNATQNLEFTIPFRGPKVRKYAVEVICLEISKYLRSLKLPLEEYFY